MNKKHYDKSRIIVEEREELYILVPLLALFFLLLEQGPYSFILYWAPQIIYSTPYASVDFDRQKSQANSVLK